MSAFVFDIQDEVPALICEPLRQPGLITHAFSTRLGGRSRPPYATLNLGFGTGDDRACVLRNRERFGQAVGFDANDLMTVRQVHGNHIEVLTAGSDLTLTRGMPGDGLITTRSHLALGVVTADCFPMILMAPSVPAVGILHAGRQGTAAQLVPTAIALLCENYSVSARDIFAAIGPGIGGCCYEIDNVSADPFMTLFPLDVGVYRPSRPGHLYLNLEQALVLQLWAAGVPSSQVWAADLCTACHPEWFYSYRRDGPQSGRMLSVVMLDTTRSDH